MQRKITHYLISVCYRQNQSINFYNFFLSDIEIYPSRKSIEEYIGASALDSDNITVLAITPMTKDQYEQFIA